MNKRKWKILDPVDLTSPPRWIQPRDTTTNSPISTVQAVTSRIRPFATMNQPTLAQTPHVGNQPESSNASSSRIQSSPAQAHHGTMSLDEAQSYVTYTQAWIPLDQADLDKAQMRETNAKEGLRRAKNNVIEAQLCVDRAIKATNSATVILMEREGMFAKAQDQLRRVQAVHQPQHHGSQQHALTQSRFCTYPPPSDQPQYGDASPPTHTEYERAKYPALPRQLVPSTLPSTHPQYDKAEYPKIQPKINPPLRPQSDKAKYPKIQPTINPPPQVPTPSYLLSQIPKVVGGITLQPLGCNEGCLEKQVGWWICRIDPKFKPTGPCRICERCAVPIIVLDREVSAWCSRVVAARNRLCNGKHTLGMTMELLEVHRTEVEKAVQDLKHRFQWTLIEENHEFDYQNFEYRRTMSFEMEVICGTWELECLGIDFQFFSAIDIGHLDVARRIAEDSQDADYQYLRRLLETWAGVTRQYLMVRVQEKVLES